MGNIKFATIKSLDLEKPATWQNNAFLTLDIDWAKDDVLHWVIDEIDLFVFSPS